MSDLYDLALLLAFGAFMVGWFKLSYAREQAVEEARRQCMRHGLQLLDDSVGLSGVCWRRSESGLRLHRRYDFEVSIDGDDREAGWLWMSGKHLCALRLPTIEWRIPAQPDASTSGSSITDNVIPFRGRLRDPGRRD